LSEVLAKPGTEELHLRRIAPTVLVSQLPLADVVDGLREAGFTPVAEGPDGNVLDLRTSGHRVRGGNRKAQNPAVQHLPGPEQLEELVAQLRAGDRAGTARRGSTVTPERGRPSADATLRLLRDAASGERDVWLGFVDTHGVRSQRVVRPLEV